MLARDTTTRARIAKQRTRHIRSLSRQIQELTQQITTVVKTTGATLTHIHGIGNLTAAEIIAQVGNPAHYPTKAKFAMANDTAPLEASSGRITRHRLNRGGNRRINQALYTAALTQISQPGSEGHRYYQKQLARGKTPKEAIRNLKRHISNRVYKHLQPPPPNLTVRIWRVPLEAIRYGAGIDVVTLNLTDPVWCLSYDLSDIDHQRRPGVPRWPDQKPVHPKGV